MTFYFGLRRNVAGSTSSFSYSFGSRLFSRQEYFAQTRTLAQHQRIALRERLRQHLRIFDQHFVVQLIAIDARIALDQVQRVAVHEPIPQPAAGLEARDVDNERILLPARDGVAEEAGLGVVRMRSADGNGPERPEVFVEDDQLLRRVHEFDRKQTDGSHPRRRLRQAVRGRIVHRSSVQDLPRALQGLRAGTEWAPARRR